MKKNAVQNDEKTSSSLHNQLNDLKPTTKTGTAGTRWLALTEL